MRERSRVVGFALEISGCREDVFKCAVQLFESLGPEDIGLMVTCAVMVLFQSGETSE